MKSIHDIVEKGLCIGCGICAYSDAIQKTTYSTKFAQNIPLITEQNKNNRLAFDICPGKGYNIIEDANQLYKSAKYDLELGRSYGQYAAFSNDTEILTNASSGGVMSQIAVFLLERNIVDRVLTTRFTYVSGPRTLCILAKSKDDIIRSQGSKYCPVDLSLAIREIKSNNYRVAIIGTPCQIAGIRNIQKVDQSFREKVVLTIANFCGGIKSYNNIDLLAERQHINPNTIKFFRFRGNGQPGSMLIEDNSGKTAEVPYPKYVGLNGLSKHLRCHLCVDATGELADIACGDAWLPRFLQDKHPWSIIITRNKTADDLIYNMICDHIITARTVSSDEIKLSQLENLTSKKVRQKSRRYLYGKLAYQLPLFDGGYFDNKIDLWTELKVFGKHKAKQLLETLHLFSFVRGLLKHRQ
jgi:coenzyme F420 hydrogenase subunit beta